MSTKEILKNEIPKLRKLHEHDLNNEYVAGTKKKQQQQQRSEHSTNFQHKLSSI